jgi:flagellar basal-body rod protein FlgG
MKALGTAATGMLAQQTNVDVIANNIANANTTGFKAGRAAFQDLIYQTQRREGAATGENGTTRPVSVDIGLGVQAAGVTRLSTQGGLVDTGNSLDMAIDGRGFFTITMPDGSSAYTRAGNFTLSPEGELVTLDGFLIQPEIVVPENTTEIEISADGIIQAYVGDEAQPQELGQITLATFINEAGLKAIGRNLLIETAASGEVTLSQPGGDGIGLIQQRYLESSNVDPVKQITDLITAQRTYEMNSKSMTAANEMMQSTNQIR